jgi:hypothetical protein
VAGSACLYVAISNIIFNKNYYYIVTFKWGQDGSFGIATRYGLEGPGIETRRGRDFPHMSRPSLGPTQPPIKWVLGLFPGSKAAGAWR